VVNSSQGGGSKDTWVVDTRITAAHAAAGADEEADADTHADAEASDASDAPDAAKGAAKGKVGATSR
jgi:hypothetical protein